MTSNTTDKHGLRISPILADFIENEALPGTGIDSDRFWSAFGALMDEMTPRNRALLAERDRLQSEIDDWHRAHRGEPHDHKAYKAFLKEIGYLREEGDAFAIDTANTDPEFASVAGPQLVVPITNARYALNAANARWGSLYDAFYGTDATDGVTPSGGYDKGRGARVVAKARVFLDEAFPLDGTSHVDARR